MVAGVVAIVVLVADNEGRSPFTRAITDAHRLTGDRHEIHPASPPWSSPCDLGLPIAARP